MLSAPGPVVAPADVAPEHWARALPADAAPLILAPTSERGWFDGACVVAWGPSLMAEGLATAEAADILEAAFRSTEPALVAALLPYDGSATVARYAGGLVLARDGWRLWGEPPASPAGGVTSPGVSEVNQLPPEAPLVSGATVDMTPAEFRAAVREVREAIRAGDVYVLNLTVRFTGEPALEPADAFGALLGRARAQMAAFWSTPSLALASVSPERFVRVRGREIEVHPIKGTRPRGADAVEDQALAAELTASAKERSEHVMIVDLERNDLGRVCEPGTIGVDPLFGVFATPYCHQMVSRVYGTLRLGASVGEVLQATFPCGSVTGAPKIAAMRKIAELEASPRSAYTGSLVVAVPGAIDSSVLIRTAEYAGGMVRWGAGGGITIDSDPAEEWLETLLKASPFLGDGTPSVGLREMCRVVSSGVPLISRHLARLAGGGCGPTALGRVRSAIAAAVDGGCPAPVGRLGVTVLPEGEVTAEADSRPSALDVEGGPVVAFVACDPPSLPPGGAKPAARAVYDKALDTARAQGADMAVLVDRDGRVFDAATANVWVVIGGRLLTPPTPPAVDGVGRGVVLDAAYSLGIEVAEVPNLLPADLADADEVFVSNALAGVVPVRGRGGPVTGALAELWRAAVGR